MSIRVTNALLTATITNDDTGESYQISMPLAREYVHPEKVRANACSGYTDVIPFGKLGYRSLVVGATTHRNLVPGLDVQIGAVIDASEAYSPAPSSVPAVTATATPTS